MADWRDISTAPKDGTHVLVYLPEPRTLSQIIVAYQTGLGGWWTHDDHWMNDMDDESDFDIEPTHWQPLPAPPHGQETPAQQDHIDAACAVTEALTIQTIASLAAKHGMAVVPFQPTVQMFRAAFAEMNRTPSGVWKDMKAAKKTPRDIFDTKMTPRYHAMIASGRVKP